MGLLLLLLLLAAPGLLAETKPDQPASAGPARRLTQPLLRRADALRAAAERNYEKGRYEQAAQQYAAAYRLVAWVDPVRAASLCLDRSSLDYMDGQTRRAIARCQTGLRHLQNLPADSARFKLYSGLGFYYADLTRYDSAAHWFGLADSVLLARPALNRHIPLYVLFHLNNQAVWFRREGDYARSLLYLAQARDLARTCGTPEDRGYIETNIASCYEGLGQPQTALRHWQAAQRLHRKPDIQQVRICLGLGWACYRLCQPRLALRQVRAASRLLARLRQPPATDETQQLKTWQLLAACYRATRQWTRARQTLQTALTLLNHRPDMGDWKAGFLAERGLLDQQRGQPRAAWRDYEAARLALMQQPRRADGSTPSDPLLLALLHQQARLLRQQGQAAAALCVYEQALRVQQRLGLRMDTDAARLTLMTRTDDLPGEAIATACAAGTATARQQQGLFWLFELAQATSLRQSLHLRRAKAQAVPPGLLARERGVAEMLGRQPQSLPAQLAWHQLQLLFRRKYLPGQSPAPPLSLPRLQQRLGSQTAYLAYRWQGSSLFVLLVTSGSVRVLRQAVDSLALRRHLDQLHHQLYTNPLAGQYGGRASAVWLYQQLLEPLRPWLRGRSRLVVARDYRFNDLPMEVLETGQRAHDYVGLAFAVSYAFSAQLFFAPAPQRPTLLPPLVIAPFARLAALAAGSTRQEAARPLLASETEARQIGGEVWLGGAATKQRLRQTALARPAIYLATHAQANDRQPDSSFVALGPGPANRLFASEIMTLPLADTRLLVLGACSAGSGQAIRGEGTLSLARAFVYAGCRSVVTPLWEANDQTTAWLTVRLDRHLRQGLPIDQALQQTRQDFFASELAAEFDHPFYWANLVLFGSYEPVYAPAPSYWPYLTAVGLLLVGLAGAGWYRHQTTRPRPAAFTDWQ